MYLEQIHMNGRVYNPTLARFVSADPIISNPDDTQNYNRYSYVHNRPMFFTDPSGFETANDEEKYCNCDVIDGGFVADDNAQVQEAGNRVRAIMAKQAQSNGGGKDNGTNTTAQDPAELNQTESTKPINGIVENTETFKSKSGTVTTAKSNESTVENSSIRETKEWKQIANLMKSGRVSDRQKAIELAINLGNIDVSKVNGKVLYGGGNRTYPDGRVTIGSEAFMNNKYFQSSPGWLMATIAHETEAHINMQVRMDGIGFWRDEDGMSNTIEKH